MTVMLTALSRHEELLAEVNSHIDLLFASNMRKSSTGDSAKDIARSYSTELLELLLLIFNDDDMDDYDLAEVVELISMPRYSEYMAPAANLRQQLKPTITLSLRDSIGYIRHLSAYASDPRVPAVPETGYPVDPINLALIMVAETTYVLCETTEFDGIHHRIIDWIEGTTYKVISDELVEYLSQRPQNGPMLALLGNLMETMLLDELLPYVTILEQHPERQERLLALLSQDGVRGAQVEAILSESVASPFSGGVL